MPRFLARAGLALILVGALASSAAAAAPAPATPRLYLPGIFVVARGAVTVPGRPTEVEGFVRPYVPGQSVRFTASLGSRVIRSATLRIKPVPGGRVGRFALTVRSPAPGLVRVTVSHQRTAVQRGFTVTRRYAVLSPQAAFGSRGPFVALIQQRLAALHFFIPQSGVYDSFTGLAIDAYHRLLGWGTSQRLDGPTISYLLNGWGQFKVRFPHQGRHAEGNLSRQLLALIDGAKVELIFPISSGKPSTPTVLGSYRVYSRVPGYLPDGMYYSSFFTGGYAIHGYNPAPDYPASHGCMRLPIQDAIAAYDWLALHDWVDVYY